MAKRGPKKEYMKLKNCVAEAILYSYSIPENDRRILGWIVRWSWGMQFDDWVRVSVADIEKELDIGKRSIFRSLQRLLEMNAIRRRGEGKKGSPYEYSPQKFVQLWRYDLLSSVRPFYKPKEDDLEDYELALKGVTGDTQRRLEKGAKIKKKGAEIAKKGCGNRQNEVSAMTPKTESEPTPALGVFDPKDSKRHVNTDPPLPPQGDECEGIKASNSLERITSAKVATETEMTVEHAKLQARASWQKRWVRDFRQSRRGPDKSEQEQVDEFFDNGPRPGFMLACWLTALRETDQDRANGKTWDSYFAQVMSKATEVFNRKTLPKSVQRESKKSQPSSYWDSSELEPQSRRLA